MTSCCREFPSDTQTTSTKTNYRDENHNILLPLNKLETLVYSVFVSLVESFPKGCGVTTWCERAVGRAAEKPTDRNLGLWWPLVCADASNPSHTSNLILHHF